MEGSDADIPQVKSSLTSLWTVFWMVVAVNAFHLYLIHPWIKDHSEILNEILIIKAITVVIAPVVIALLASMLWLPFAGIASIQRKKPPPVSKFIIGWASVASIIGIVMAYGDYASIKRQTGNEQASNIYDNHSKEDDTKVKPLPESIPLVPNPNLAVGAQEKPCVYKAVMSNADYKACGIEPPR